jgi:carboxymethylenebutenolidase
VHTESTYPTHPDGPMRLYQARPDGPTGPIGASRGAVIVIQEAFGVNDHIEDVTRRFADAGYHAVAPDLFHRAGGGTAPYDDFAQVLPLFEGIDGDDAILRDLDATLAALHGYGWTAASIGIVGFCLGGRISLLAALRRPLGAAVSFYGGGVVTGRFPQFPPLIDEVPSLAVPWLGLFGDLDESIPVDDVEVLRQALVSTSVDTEVVRYADAGHGFHCDQRASYDEAAARDGWARTLAWFDAHLA